MHYTVSCRSIAPLSIHNAYAFLMNSVCQSHQAILLSVPNEEPRKELIHWIQALKTKSRFRSFGIRSTHWNSPLYSQFSRKVFQLAREPVHIYFAFIFSFSAKNWMHCDVTDVFHEGMNARSVWSQSQSKGSRILIIHLSHWLKGVNNWSERLCGC